MKGEASARQDFQCPRGELVVRMADLDGAEERVGIDKQRNLYAGSG